MKIKAVIYALILPGILLSLLLNCKKEAIKTAPTATIATVTNITATSATSGGEITSDGGSAVTARGVCWSTNQSPTTSDNKTTNGSGTGSFTSSITGLTPGTIYNLRAYAINAVGTAYSNRVALTTLALLPVLTTADLTALTSTSATSGGNITNDGGAPVTARGVCWSKSQNPTTSDSKTTDATGSGIFSSSITGLTPGMTYYARAYATNSVGTAYGNQITTTTAAILPKITTADISVFSATTATSGGNITSDGGAVVTIVGVCWSTNQNPTITDLKTMDSTVSGSFTSFITGLTPGTTYYIRGYATNKIGTAYGNQLILTTTAILPLLTTSIVKSYTSTTALCGGNIINDGGATVTARGVCWSEHPNPTVSDSHTTDGDGRGMFTTTLTNLQSATTYYFRAYAINRAGISYGNSENFTTSLNIPSGTKTKFLTLISINSNWSTYEDNTWEKNFQFKENEYMQIFEICIWNTANPKVSLYMFDRNFEPKRMEFLSGGQDWVSYRESYNIMNIETPSKSSQQYLDAFKKIIKKVIETQPAEHYGIKYWGHGAGSSSPLFGYTIWPDEAEMLLSYINSLISKKIDFLDWSRNCGEGRYNRIVKEYKYADYILASDISRMGYAMAGGAVESSEMIETFFSPSKSIRQSLIDMINQDRLHWESDFTKKDMITNKIMQSISLYDTDKFEDMVSSTKLSSTDYAGDILKYIHMNYPSEVQKFFDFRFCYVSNKDFFTWDIDSNGFFMDDDN